MFKKLITAAVLSLAALTTPAYSQSMCAPTTVIQEKLIELTEVQMLQVFNPNDVPNYTSKSGSFFYSPDNGQWTWLQNDHQRGISCVTAFGKGYRYDQDTNTHYFLAVRHPVQGDTILVGINDETDRWVIHAQGPVTGHRQLFSGHGTHFGEVVLDGQAL